MIITDSMKCSQKAKRKDFFYIFLWFSFDRSIISNRKLFVSIIANTYFYQMMVLRLTNQMECPMKTTSKQQIKEFSHNTYLHLLFFIFFLLIHSFNLASIQCWFSFLFFALTILSDKCLQWLYRLYSENILS